MVTVGVDVPTSQIEVGVAGASASDRDALAEVLAPDVRVVAADPLRSVSLPSICDGISVCPLRAGLDVSNLGYEECTSNDFFHDTGSGIIWTSTSGHCFSSSWPNWYEGRTTAHFIGGNVVWSFHGGMYVDAGLIYQSSTMPKNLVYVSSGQKGRAMNGYLTNSQQTSGAVACAAGITSGYRCNYVNGTNLTVSTTVGTWYHAWRAGFGSGSGDSGGPVFYGSRDMGMVDATSGGNTYYSTIDWIDSEFGVYPCVTSSC